MVKVVGKQKCKYWGKCYRKDKTHKANFFHPGDISDSDSDTEVDEPEDDKPQQDKKPTLVGKSVVFTGVLTGQTRVQAELEATRYGCLAAASVTKGVDYLIMGDEAGSKADKAKAMGITCLSQAEWKALIKKSQEYTGPRLTRTQSLTYNEDSANEEKASTSAQKAKKVVKFNPKTTIIGGGGDGDRKRAAANQHDVSDSEDEEVKPSPPKRKRSDPPKKAAPAPAPAAATATADKKTRRAKCKYWAGCFRKNKAHKKEFCHPGDSDEDEAVDEMETDEVDPSSLPTPKNPIKDGETVKVEGRHQAHTMKRTGDTYYCDCYQWKMSKRAPNKRTCKHLKAHLGDKHEDARCGEEITAGSEVINRAPRHKAIPQVLLANKWDEKTVNPTGWWLSEKLDGVRAYWDGKAFYSRLGNEFIPPSWFIKGFPSDMTLDGELFGGRGKFQSTVSIVKNPGSGRWKEIKFHIFDAPSLGKQQFEDRVSTITDYFKKNSAPYVQVLEHQKCTGVGHLKAELKKVEAKGGEGLMIREPKSVYENRRSKTLLKIKTFHDAEAKVIGHEKGKGRNQFVCGALQCVMECGKRFKVGSGLTDADRRKPPKVGAIITYRFQEYTLDGIPRFPTFVGVRIDANKPKDAVLPQKTDD